MNFLGAIAVVILFIAFAYLLRIVRQAGEVMSVSKKSMDIIGDASIEDEEKEKLVQANAIRLAQLLGLLVFGFAVALLAPMGVIWLLEKVGLMSLEAVMAILIRWDFIVGASIVCIAAYFMLERRRR